jgi:hypothetical protein
LEFEVSVESDLLNIYRDRTFTSLFDVETYAVVLLNVCTKTGFVYKSFGIGIIVLDEAEAFFAVEELNSSG